MSYEISSFALDVLDRSYHIPVLVDFWAEWCGPCKVLGPVLERLAEQAKARWELAKVDTEVHQDVATQYRIQSIPNVKLFVDGEVAAEFVGALPEHVVKQWLQKNIPGVYRKDVENAESLLLHGEMKEAQDLLQVVVAHEQDNHKAHVLLAQTFLNSEPEKALELVHGIDEDSEFSDRAESIRVFASLLLKSEETLPDNAVKQIYLSAIRDVHDNKPDSALEKFIEVIRSDRYYDDDGSRKACIAIFKLLGEEHEITLKYRRDFNRALY